MRPNMEDNFNLLDKRVLDILSKTDLERIKDQLNRIKGATLCVGVGGSKVVSDFASKVLSQKNNCITESIEPRDMLYKNISTYENVFMCSYGGHNYGVDVSFNNSLNKYLLSSKTREGVHNITYQSDLETEDSFISLGATLMPMSILLSFYTGNDVKLIQEILESKRDYLIEPSEIYEILTGYDTSVASAFLESTMTESGIALPLIHDKYGYCHGRSTISKSGHNSVILLNRGSELDEVLLEEFPKYYRQIIEIKSRYRDQIIDDFYLTYQTMWLARSIAHIKNKDLSRVEYAPMVKKLYHYKGEM